MAIGGIGGNARVVVDFVANTAGLSSGLKDAQSQAQTTGTRLKGMGKAALVAGGAAGLAALVGTLKVGVGELAQAQKVTAQTNAVLKSTGGIANVSAKHVDDLAGALMAKSGVDDEAIASGENLLLTFTRIRNEAGKGNDVFDQATKAALDMSVALGQDMAQSSVLVGKALNDPVKGLTALQRVGVTFTKAQKKQIQAMAESGDQMGAQKLILKELKTEFGGSAEAAGKTLPGQLAIAQESFANLAGEIVGVLVPVMTAVATFFRENPKLAKAMVIGVLALAAAMVVLNGVMLVASVVSLPISGTFLLIAAAIAGVVVAVILAIKYWDQIVSAFQSGFSWLKANWPLLLAIIAGPIGLAVAAIVTHWDKIESATKAAWNAVKTAVSVAVNAMVNGVKAAWNGLMTFLGALGGRISNVFDAVRSWLKRPGEWAEDAAQAVKGAWNGLMTFLGQIPGRLAGVLDGVRSWLKRPGQWADEAADAVVRAFDNIVSAARGLAGKLAAPISAAASAIKGPLNAVISAWNRASIPGFSKSIDTHLPKVGKITFGWPSIAFPDITPLARGGVVSSPTLAMVGEGAGREIVSPEALLREIVGSAAPDVRVFIGDTELRDLVRYEVRQQNTRLAQTLIAGTR